MHKPSQNRFIDTARPLHATENRLTKRLFQLEERVDVLEEQVEDMTALIETLFGLEMHEPSSEFSVRFCTCDDEDDEEDEEDD